MGCIDLAVVEDEFLDEFLAVDRGLTALRRLRLVKGAALWMVNHLRAWAAGASTPSAPVRFEAASAGRATYQSGRLQMQRCGPAGQ
jgi:hypothetical protein